MTAILNRVFVLAGKVLAYHAIENSSVSQRVCRNNFKTFSTVFNSRSSSHLDEELQVDELLPNANKPPESVLSEPNKLSDLSHITPEIRPSLNFAYYANKSEVIKQLIDLGMDFHKIEQREKIPTFLLQLDFEKDVKPYISFLHENGVPSDQLGLFFTKNPFLLEQSLDDLQVRINYLRSKNFTPEMISRIITAYPYWLNHPTKAIDRRLGNIQKVFKLTGEEIRSVVCRRPQIIAMKKLTIQDKIFLFKDIIGFTFQQTKNLFLKQPYVWSLHRDLVQERLDIMLRDMEIPLSVIEEQPSGLVCRAHKLKERHLFLKKLGKAQYDPKKPGYVSIDLISKGNDVTFCQNTAKTSIETFNLFLKTL